MITVSAPGLLAKIQNIHLVAPVLCAVLPCCPQASLKRKNYKLNIVVSYSVYEPMSPISQTECWAPNLPHDLLDTLTILKSYR